MHDWLAAGRAIDGHIWSSEMLTESLTTLIDVYGPRFAGTPAELDAGEWLARRLEALGLDNVHREAFDYLGWREIETSLEMTVADRPPRSLAAVAHVYSPPTPPGGLVAPVVYVGSGRSRQFEALKAQIGGCFVLCETTPWPTFWRGSANAASPIRLSIDAGAVGFVLMGYTPGAGPRVGTCGRGEPCPIPCVGIGREEGEFLKRTLDRGRQVELGLRSRTETAPATGYNVVGEVRARHNGDNVLLLTAHYDGHRIGQAAQDNASGVAAVLEVARALASMRSALRHHIRVVLFSAEEYGLLGAEAYAAAHRQELERMTLILNVDIAWPPFGLAAQASPALTAAIRETCDRLGMEVHVYDTLSLGSDHEPFVKAGVPAIVYEGALPTGGLPFPHTATDTFDKVDVEGIKQAASMMAKVLFDLAVRERIPADRLSPAGLQAFLQKGP